MNIVQARCPHCKRQLRIPADWLEKPMRCKFCKNTFQAKPKETEPGQPSAAAPPVPPASVPPLAYQYQQQPANVPPSPQWQAPPATPTVWAPGGMPAPPVTPMYQTGAQPPMMPPAYPPPGYGVPSHAAPGYAPPGYAPIYATPVTTPAASAPPSPAANFGFDDSQLDGEIDVTPSEADVVGSPRLRSPKTEMSKIGLLVVGGLFFLTAVVLIVLAPQIWKAMGRDTPKQPEIAPHKGKSPKEIELAKANEKFIKAKTAEFKANKVNPVPIKDPAVSPQPKPAVAFGGLPRRALFIAPEHYLLLNTTYFYQAKDGPGAGENALLYRFTQGAPLNLEKSQVFVLSDSVDEKAGGAVPQKDVIEAAIKDFAETSRPQDRVILFFSGHACDHDGKGYLIPIEGDKDDKDSLIAIDWVYEQLAKCKARQKVFIVDAFRFPPARGLELPATGAMTEAVDKQLDNPPAGVQVVTACVKDQQSLEFDNGSLFQSAFKEALKGQAIGSIVQAKDPLPIGDLVVKINAFMKENLPGAPGVEKKENDEPALTQTCRLSGKDPEAGAEPNTAEPAPKAVAFLSRDKDGAGSQMVKSILDEIKMFPPMKKGQVQQLANLTLAALPGAGKEIEEYKDDGFNPFSADAAVINQMKDQYPLRAISYEISTKLKEFVDLPMREVLNNPGGPIDGKAKAKFLKEQKDPALATLVLEELLADAAKLAESRDQEKSKRWQAHFDLAMARLQSRLVYIYEYNNLLALVRTDSLPMLESVHTGWRVNTSAKIQIKEPSVKEMAKQAGKTWDRMGKEYPNTPWAVIARRERNVAMGLQWVPTKD
jgi:hypothetical protein